MFLYAALCHKLNESYRDQYLLMVFVTSWGITCKFWAGFQLEHRNTGVKAVYSASELCG